MIHSFSLRLDGFSEVTDFIAHQFAAAFVDGDAVPRTTVGVPYLDVDRETDKPLDETIRDVIDEVRALGYEVKGVQVDAVDDINRELSASH